MKRMLNKIKDFLIGLILSIAQLLKAIIWGLIKAIRNKVVQIINGFKSFFVSIYKLIVESNMKQRATAFILFFIVTLLLVFTSLTKLQANEISYQDRVAEEGTLIDLDYQDLKISEENFTIDNDSNIEARINLKTTGVVLSVNGNEYSTLSTLSNAVSYKSPFTIQYKKESDNRAKTLNAYSNSIELGKYKVYKITNGVRVDYEVQDYNYDNSDFPTYISKDHFENKVIASLDNRSDVKYIKKYYKYDVTKNAYYLKNTSATVLPRLYEILFDNSSYTFKDMEADNKYFLDSEAEVLPKARFTIPVEYIIEEGQLKVNVLLQNAVVTPGYQIIFIDLLPSFGATLYDENAFAFLPNGSGGIVELNQIKGDNDLYIDSFYKKDQILNSSKLEFSEDITMPVYGISNGNTGIMGIIEKSASAANLVLSLSKNELNPNRMFLRFDIINEYFYDFYGDQTTILRMYSDMNLHEISVNYQLLNKDTINYFEMAKIYQDYLVKKYSLNLQTNIDSGIALDIIGGIKKKKSLFGITYNSLEYATNYSEARDIIAELSSVDDLTVTYKGWMNNGYNHELPNKISLDKQGGDKESFNQLNEYTKQNDIKLFYDISFIETYDDKTNGFKAKENGVRLISNELYLSYPYNPATLEYDKMYSGSYLVNPYYLDSIFSGFMKSANDYGIRNIAFRNIGNKFYANYGREQVSSQAASYMLESQIDKLYTNDYKLLFKDGFEYTYQYASYQTDVSTSTSSESVIDYAVPFKSLVFNGLFDYSGRSINVSNEQSFESNYLRSIEFGMDIKYTVAKENSIFFKDTEFSYYYGINFNQLKDEIIQVNNKLKQDKLLVGNGHIVNHERIEDKVFKVTYENGNTLIFNYNDYEVQYPTLDIKIKPLSYVVE